MYDQMEVEAEEYQLKPMNCPFHIAVYKQGAYSYRCDAVFTTLLATHCIPHGGEDLIKRSACMSD